MGKEGRQAALEVLRNGSLVEAASANPSLASISADLKVSWCLWRVRGWGLSLRNMQGVQAGLAGSRGAEYELLLRTTKAGSDADRLLGIVLDKQCAEAGMA